jgi:hypothetical protein
LCALLRLTNLGAAQIDINQAEKQRIWRNAFDQRRAGKEQKNPYLRRRKSQMRQKREVTMINPRDLGEMVGNERLENSKLSSSFMSSDS